MATQIKLLDWIKNQQWSFVKDAQALSTALHNACGSIAPDNGAAMLDVDELTYDVIKATCLSLKYGDTEAEIVANAIASLDKEIIHETNDGGYLVVIVIILD
jgi:hypothetical protein